MTIRSPGRRLRWWLLLVLVLNLGLMLRLVATEPEADPPARPPSPAAPSPRLERPPSHYLLSEEKKQLIEVLEGFIVDLQTRPQLSAAERVQNLRRSLNRSAAILAPAGRPTLESTAVFKFPLRRMAEELAELDSGALQEVSKHFTRRGYRNGGESWTFDPLEEVLYQTVFHDPEYIEPVLAMQIMAWEVKGDREPIRALLLKQNAGDDTKADTIRQFFTGNTSTRSGARQMQRALKVLDPSTLEGCTWAELGYGTGQIFEAVRESRGTFGEDRGGRTGPGLRDAGRTDLQASLAGMGTDHPGPGQRGRLQAPRRERGYRSRSRNPRRRGPSGDAGAPDHPLAEVRQEGDAPWRPDDPG